MYKKNLEPKYESQVFLCNGGAENYLWNVCIRSKGDHPSHVILARNQWQDCLPVLQFLFGGVKAAGVCILC